MGGPRRGGQGRKANLTRCTSLVPIRCPAQVDLTPGSSEAPIFKSPPEVIHIIMKSLNIVDQTRLAATCKILFAVAVAKPVRIPMPSSHRRGGGGGPGSKEEEKKKNKNEKRCPCRGWAVYSFNHAFKWPGTDVCYMCEKIQPLDPAYWRERGYDLESRSRFSDWTGPWARGNYVACPPCREVARKHVTELRRIGSSLSQNSQDSESDNGSLSDVEGLLADVDVDAE